MPHYEARLSSKGQITIPAAVRDLLALKEGDIVDFYLSPRSTGVQLLARNAKLTDLLASPDQSQDRGAKDQKPIDIDKAIGAYLSEKHDRISREWNEWREFQEWKKAHSAKAAE